VFTIIHELRTQFPVVLLCEIAGVSTAGYYKWVKRQTEPSKKQLEDQWIMDKIMECETDKEINWSYGYLRVKTWFQREYNININHKRIYRLMKKMGIQAKIRRKKWKYFGRKEAYVISKNHLNREFTAERPNQKWVTDITYLIFNGQRLYLSAILDLYNNEIVGYEISERNDLSLVINTVKKAIKKRDVNGLLLHSDQGYQYISQKYHQLLQEYNIKASMSRKGNCFDNACIESFFSHFKTECFYRYRFQTPMEVRKAVERYITFYNHKRFQKKLNNLTPIEFRGKAA
jgi:putative transposase